MRSLPPDESPQVAQPQHISDILPHVLARHGLVPADVWRAETPPRDIAPGVPSLDISLLGVSMPLSIS